MRRTGRFEEAVEEYRLGLAALDGSERDDAQLRLLLLESMSAVFGDAGQHEEALGILEEAIAGLEALAGTPQQLPSDLADAYQRRANVLITLGEYAAARDAAEASIAAYRPLVEAGRQDLALAAARVWSGYAIAAERTGDPEVAIEALRAARATFAAAPLSQRQLDGQPDDLIGVLDRWIDRLAELTGIRPEGVGPWLAQTAERLDRADAQSRAGHVDAALLTNEEVLGELLWLTSRYPADEVYALFGHAAIGNGMMAMYRGRDRLAKRGFRLAVECYRGLVEDRGRREHIEAWVNAQLGLVVQHALLGDDEGTARLLTELDRGVRRVDPGRRAYWADRVQAVIASVRRPSGG